MRNHRQDFVLGSVALLFLTLFVASILFIQPLITRPTRTFMVQFRHDDGVAPIKVGSPVLLSGAIEVGTVKSVRLLPPDPKVPGSALLILVEARIDENLQLYRDCRITTDQPPVGGAGVLVILSVGTAARGMVGQEPVNGLAPQSFASVVGALSRRLLDEGGFFDKLERQIDDQAEGSLVRKLGQSLTDINAMTNDLRAQLSVGDRHTLMSKVHRVADNLQDTTAALREQAQIANHAGALAKILTALDSVNETLNEATQLLRENRPKISATLTNVEQASQTLSGEIMPAVRDELRRDDPTTLLGRIHETFSQLDRSVSNVVEITDTGKRIMTSNRPTIDRTLENVKAASDQLRLGVQELLLSPWRLLQQPPADELARVDAFEAARRFAEAARALDDAAARLEAVASSTPPGTQDPAAIAELEAVQKALQGAFERFRTAEDFLWEKMKK